MDISTILGITVGLSGIIVGLILEGGNIGQITHPTSALIVLGGTIGAVMIQHPLNTFISALKSLKNLIKPPVMDPGQIIEDLTQYATKARKEGIISLEAEAKNIKEPFLKKAIMMAVDGADPKELKHTLEHQLGYIEEHGQVIAKVWEAAGAFAPTIGIIGAVMGLIQVMSNLEDIEKVGRGIAGAFVATIYALLFANLIFIPAAGKLSLQNKKKIVVYEMIIEGILLVIEGVNPMVMRDKLSGYFVEPVLKNADAKKEGKK